MIMLQMVQGEKEKKKNVVNYGFKNGIFFRFKYLCFFLDEKSFLFFIKFLSQINIF